MLVRRATVRKMLAAVAGVCLVSTARGTTYTDVTGTDHFSGPEVDFSSVVVTNTASDLDITINMNPSADLGVNHFGKYEMGIQLGNGAGGQTLINNDFNKDPAAGNPYGSQVGISTGVNIVLASFLSPDSGTTAGGAQAYVYSASAGWTDVYDDTAAADATRFSEVFTGTPSISFSFPLSALGISSGTTFKFDVWSTFDGGQGAYDALDNPNTPPQPFTPVVPYDSATVAGSVLSSYTVSIPVVNSIWNIDGGGSWNDPASWTPTNSVPNGPASTATFGSILDSAGSPPAIVTLTQSQTVGQITFNNSNQYQIMAAAGSAAGTGLVIDDSGDSGGVSPLISAVTGSHVIGVPVYLANGVTLNATGATSSLSISGNISNATGGLAGTVTISGAGSVTLSGANSYTGNTVVNSGATLNVASSSSAATALPATTKLSSNGTTNFLANPGTGILAQTIAGITLSTGGKVIVANPTGGALAGHANRSVLVLTAGAGSLAFGGTTNGWQGLLNLNGNDLVVQGGSSDGTANLTAVTNQLKQGFNAGSGYWNGSAGITSGAAASDTRFLTTLGSGLSNAVSFDGVNTSSSDVLVKYTYYGDADLNGTVNGADYQKIDLGFGMHLTGWSNGDFNYDGVVNGTDFALIDNTFNQLTARGLTGTPLGIIAGPADLGASVSAVPEPTMMGLLGVGAAMCLSRRRQRRL